MEGLAFRKLVLKGLAGNVLNSSIATAQQQGQANGVMEVLHGTAERPGSGRPE
jgi:uncharacterized protein YejL (UPF0352 family)